MKAKKAQTSALALAMTAAVGCTPTRAALRREAAKHYADPAVQQAAYFTPNPSPAGQTIQAKRCDVRVYHLPRPLNDEVINEQLWSSADEQAVPDEVRRVLEANGLRLGLIVGGLPQGVQDLLNAKPPHQVEPAQVNVPSGDSQLLPLSPTVPRLSLMLNRDGRTTGKEYTDAHGFIRMTPSHDASGGVALRLVPELHHGPMQHRFAAAEAPSPFAVQQFIMKDGQQEDTLRELAATVSVRPGQYLVLGCLPDHPRSLGHFLLTEPEANSDRLLQKVILIEASQNQLAPIAVAMAPRDVTSLATSPPGQQPAANTEPPRPPAPPREGLRDRLKAWLR